MKWYEHKYVDPQTIVIPHVPALKVTQGRQSHTDLPMTYC